MWPTELSFRSVGRNPVCLSRDPSLAIGGEGVGASEAIGATNFTHAYFPTSAFDEYHLEGNWAFARKGQAYLAITAARGMSLVVEGPSAYRELRSYGRRNIWLCLLGREASDGSFQQFQRRVAAQRPVFSELAVRFRSLRGDTIAFGWTGPLVVNGQEQPLSGFKHYDSVYCTSEAPPVPVIEVRTPSFALRLSFGQ